MPEPVELITIDTFGGLDLTTKHTGIPLIPNNQPKRAVGGSGYVLNRVYQAFVTTRGRTRLLSLPLSVTRGLTEFTQNPDNPRYLAAGDTSGVPATAAVLSFLPSGTFSYLSLPTALTTGNQTNFVESGQWAFMSNGVDRPIKIDESFNVTYWGISAPTTTLSAVTIGAGSVSASNAFYYAYTYGNSVQESSPSPLIGLLGVTAAGAAISVSGIATSSDAQVTLCNIYRLGGDSGQAGLWTFAGFVSNGVTQFKDNTADGMLTGQTLVQHRDPPQAFLALANFANSVWGFGYTGTAVGEPSGTPATSDAWFSNAYEPWGFNNVSGIIPCGRNAGDDTIQTASDLGGILVVLKRQSIWVITGNSAADFFAEQLFEIGCAAPLSVVYALGQLFWLAYDTVYTFAGGAYSDIGMLLKSFIFNLDDEDRAAAVGGFYDKQYVLSFPTLGVTYKYDLRSGEWLSDAIAFAQVTFDPEGPAEISELNDLPLLILGAESNSGNIDAWYSAETDLGNNLTSSYLSAVSDCGAPQFTKQLQYGVLVVPPTPALTVAQVTVTITSDPGTPIAVATSVGPYNITGTQLHNYTFALPKQCSGRFFQVEIDVTSNTAVQVSSLRLYGTSLQHFAVNA